MKNYHGGVAVTKPKNTGKIRGKLNKKPEDPNKEFRYKYHNHIIFIFPYLWNS